MPFSRAVCCCVVLVLSAGCMLGLLGASLVFVASCFCVQGVKAGDLEGSWFRHSRLKDIEANLDEAPCALGK